MITRAALFAILTLPLGAPLACAIDAERSAVADLPLVEVQPNTRLDWLAVFYSGDGGWASLDQGVSARLAEAGVKVVGVNSLRYLWRERRPEECADDLARVLGAYLANRSPDTKVLLVGYSTGADVLPFIVNRLPEELRARVASLTLIAPGAAAEFAIHVADWIPGRAATGTPLMPEIEKLEVPVLCVYGDGDKGALCPELPPERASTARIGTGHHLSGDYTAIADRLLSFASKK
jgi:type IV secretory pathway VirJ component